jgi:nucleotide-binding universal stress UspA family protein
VAVKFTPASRFAAEKAAALAKVHGAGLHVFHCQDYQLTRLEDSHPDRITAQDSARRRYETDIEPLLDGLQNVVFETRPGDPAMSVCRVARESAADLIILGCHQPARKLSLGRVNYVGITILEKAHCPVMLVPLSDE